MQRALEKKAVKEAAQKAEERNVEARWVVEGAQAQCVVLHEADPLPSSSSAGAGSGAAAGRLSFRGFNPATEVLAAGSKAAAQAAAEAAAEAAGTAGKVVSDADMAARLAPKRQQPEQQQQWSGGGGGSGGDKKRRKGAAAADGAATSSSSSSSTAAREDGLVPCKEISQLKGLKHSFKIHGWCRQGGVSRAGKFRLRPCCALRQLRALLVCASGAAEVPPFLCLQTCCSPSLSGGSGGTVHIQSAEDSTPVPAAGRAALARPLAERWITVWASDTSAGLSARVCAEGEAPAEGRFNGSCIWRYGTLLNGFAGEFSREQLRNFAEALGDQIASLSRDSRVSIYGVGGGPTPAVALAEGAVSSGGTAAAALDASAPTTADPITEAVRVELQRGVQGLSAGAPYAAAGAAGVGKVSDVSAASVQSARWGLDRVDQSDLPLDGLYHFFNTGTGVHVYVVDTGIRVTHQEFGYMDGRLGSRASEAYTTRDQETVGQDCEGHGTHVAAAVGGLTFGVAKNVTLHAMRILDCQGDGSVSDVIQALSWLRDNAKRPAIATMSLGGDVQPALDQAVRALALSGVSVVVAAGNADVNACNISPAREPSAVTVGATDSSDHRLWISKGVGSNVGPCIDIFAPGKDIVSASNVADTAQEMRTGTSQGVPFVAGALALMAQNLTGASPSDLQRMLAASAVQGVTTLRAPLVVTPASLRLTNASTTSYPFRLQLGQVPASGVTVALSVDDASRGRVSPSAMEFTPETWDTSQALTLTLTPSASPDSSPLTIALRTTSSDVMFGNMGAYVSLPDMKGDTLQYPKVVPALPFTEIGDTSRYNDDYGIDVVYYFKPAANVTLVASLCGSSALKDTFDSRLYLIEDVDRGGKVSATACNNDKCGALSEITAALQAGVGYAIVVDGAGGDSGPYNITLAARSGAAVRGGQPPSSMATATFYVSGSSLLAGGSGGANVSSGGGALSVTPAAPGMGSTTGHPSVETPTAGAATEVSASFINRTLPTSTMVVPVPGTNLAWAIGVWGPCLPDCVQARVVSCLDGDGLAQLDSVCEAGALKPNGTQPCTDCAAGGGVTSTATIAIITGAAAGGLLAATLAVAAWALLRRRPRPARVAPDAPGKGGAEGGAEGSAAGSDAGGGGGGTAGGGGRRAVEGSAISCPALGGRYRLVDPDTGLPQQLDAAGLAAAALADAPALPPVVVHLPDHRLRGEDTGTPTGRRSLRQRSPTRRHHSHLACGGSGAADAAAAAQHPSEHRVYIADSRDGTPRLP
eukprot:scaffold16.g71.t1